MHKNWVKELKVTQSVANSTLKKDQITVKVTKSVFLEKLETEYISEGQPKSWVLPGIEKGISPEDEMKF